MKLIFVAVLVAMLALSTVAKVTNITDEIAQIQKALVEEKLFDFSKCANCVKANCVKCLGPCIKKQYLECAKCIGFQCLPCVKACKPSKSNQL